jgi:hypothetical protein
MKQPSTLLTLSLTLLAATACSTGPNVKEVDTSLERKGHTDTKMLGIDKKGNATLQEETPLDVEIRTTQHVNENLRMDLKTEVFNLKECWKKRASATTKEMPELTEFEGLDAKLASSTEEVGTVNGEVKVVKREDAVERYNAEKKLQEKIRKYLADAKKQREKCEFEASTATQK